MNTGSKHKRSCLYLTVVRKTLVWTFLLASSATGSHFRGALFTWSPNPDGSVNIAFRVSWRRSAGYDCDDSTIANSQLLSDSSAISCFEGCLGTIGDLSFYCTDYNLDEDWTTGRNTILYSSPPRQFSFGYTGGAWISLNGGGGDWSFKATVDLYPRSDTGKPNTSPTVDMSPVVRLMYGCQHTIQIPVNDVDGDVIRCRWAAGKQECDSVCFAFPGSHLDEEKCILSYEADDQTGYYAVALQIEDFVDESSMTPLSSIPIQFLVYVFPQAGSSCHDKPQFVSPTPNEGACISTKVGELMNVTIKARSYNRLKSVTTISAVGMLKAADVISHHPDMSYISSDVTWVPTEKDLGKDHTLCFYVSDEYGLVSNTRCVHVPVTVGRPRITTVKQKGSLKSWELILDQKYLIPSEPAFLKVYDSDNGEMVHSVDVTNSTEVEFDPENMNISVTFDYDFKNGTAYYVLISEGLVGRNTSCDSISEAVNDVEFWPLGPVVDCGCPAEIRNGTITSTNGTLYPSMITYSCDKLFFLVGDRTRICQQNGIWSGSDPVCHISFLDVMWFSIKRVWRKLLPMQLPWMIAD